MSVILSLALCALLSVAPLAQGQPPSPGSASSSQVVLRYNIGGASIFGYLAEDQSLITPGNTFTSLTTELVSGELPSFVLRTHRWAQTSFTIRIPIADPGVYTCSLHWAETSDFFAVAGKRRFDIALNGRTLYNIDVFGAVGFRAEYARTITGLELDTELRIKLTKRKGDPFLAAAVCRRTALPTNPVLPAKFALNLGGPSIGGLFVEKLFWLSTPDTRTAFTNDMINGPQPKFFTGTHRWAKKTFSVRIPLREPGQYDCVLYWAEISKFFAVKNKRVFDVDLNGRRIYNVDVFKAAGFLTEYRRTVYNINVGKFLTVKLVQKKGDPFLAGVSCAKK